MKYDEFMGQVQARARLADGGRTVAAARATLEALGKRLDPGERKDLAAELPSEVGLWLRRIEGQETYGLDEFYRRVCTEEGEGTKLPDAVHHAKMVMSVVEDAVAPGEMAHVREQLPPEYDEIFSRE